MITTIGTITLENWRFGGNTATLRIYSNRQFVASTGTIVMKGSPAAGSWYKEIDCTIVGGSLVIPAIQIETTTDSDTPTATYKAILFDENGIIRGDFLPEKEDFRVTHFFGISISWTQIKASNAGQQITEIPHYLTRDQVLALFRNLPFGAATLDDLTDVVITAPLNGHVLQFSSARGLFENAAPPVTPVTPVTPPPPPPPVLQTTIATNVRLVGLMTTGQVIRLSYSFADIEGRAESGSLYEWHTYDNSEGLNDTVITGQTTTNYTLRTDDAGKLIKGFVTPKAAGGALPGNKVGSPFREAVTLAVVPPAENQKPTAQNVAVIGNMVSGQTLTARYDYFDFEGNPEGISRYEWHRSDNNAGLNEVLITGQTSIQYVLQTADVGKFIRFAVTPMAVAGTLQGDKRFSAYREMVTAPVIVPEPKPPTPRVEKPTATNVVVTGAMVVGTNLRLGYTYTNPTGGAEGASVYEWHRAQNAAGLYDSVILDETANNYTLGIGDAGRFIRGFVTPVAVGDGGAGDKVGSAYREAVTRLAGYSATGYTPLKSLSTATGELEDFLNFTATIISELNAGVHIAGYTGEFTALRTIDFETAEIEDAINFIQTIVADYTNGQTFAGYTFSEFLPLKSLDVTTAEITEGLRYIMTAASELRAAVPSDAIPPTVTITLPSAGATLTGATNPFTATATDNLGVRGVEFYLDNVIIGTEDTTPPYAVNIDATAIPAGTHTLKAIAHDAAGNPSAVATRTVTGGSAATANWEAGIIFDFDADLVTGVAANALVAAIPSRVNGTSYSATQTITAQQGTLRANRINGHAAIELLQVYGGYLVPPLPSGLTALTLAFIARQPTFDITGVRRIISDPGLNFLMSIRGLFECYLLNSVRSNVSSGHNLAVDVPHLMICEIDSAGVRYYRGATLLASVTVANPTIPPSPRIGLSPYGERVDAEITRFITVNKIWTAAEKTAFINDMNTRYGIV